MTDSPDMVKYFQQPELDQDAQDAFWRAAQRAEQLTGCYPIQGWTLARGRVGPRLQFVDLTVVFGYFSINCHILLPWAGETGRLRVRSVRHRHRSQVGLRGQFEQRGVPADGYLEWVDLGVRPDLNGLLRTMATYANAYAERFEATLTTNDTPYARDP